MWKICMGYAVRCPRTVVVHFRDASRICQYKLDNEGQIELPLAFCAVMCSGRLDSFALLAPSYPLSQFDIAFTLNVVLFILTPIRSNLLYPSLWPRIHRASPFITPPYRQHKSIEPPEFWSLQRSGLNVIEQVLRRVRQKDNEERYSRYR